MSIIGDVINIERDRQAKIYRHGFNEWMKVMLFHNNRWCCGNGLCYRLITRSCSKLARRVMNQAALESSSKGVKHCFSLAIRWEALLRLATSVGCDLFQRQRHLSTTISNNWSHSRFPSIVINLKISFAVVNLTIIHDTSVCSE